MRAFRFSVVREWLPLLINLDPGFTKNGRELKSPSSKMVEKRINPCADQRIIGLAVLEYQVRTHTFIIIFC